MSTAIKQRMEKDVDEVKKTAHYLKTKVEELDKEVRSLLKIFHFFVQYLEPLLFTPWPRLLLPYAL